MEYTECVLNKIDSVLDYMETHSVLVEVIIALIVSSLFMRKYIRQKRAEAFFGFYAKLSIYLYELRTRLEEDEQLNIKDEESGNIYTLLYTEPCQRDFCCAYHKPNTKLPVYTEIATKLKSLLTETENNVYPTGVDRIKWYENQHIIYSFCEFLEHGEYREKVNTKCAPNETEPRHIVKCRQLVHAITYIQDSLNNALY